MKNVYKILLLFVIFLPSIYADESIKKYDYNVPIQLSELVQNTTGLPCITCTCNITLYNPNGTFNDSFIMDNGGNGIFNITLPTLPINIENQIYPVVIVCNDTTYTGLSSTNGIRIEATMFDYTALALVLIAIPFLLAYIGLRLESSDPVKFWMKWVLIGLSIVMLIGGLTFANIVSGFSGISGLPDFFSGFIKIIGLVFVFFIVGLIYHLSFVKNSIVNSNKENE
jgi:uncharacterized membrane protein YhdT